MSKIAFFCIPAHGHTNPTLEVVKELVKRENEVWYYSYDTMKEKILSTGARYISCDKYDIQMNLDPKDADRVGKDIAFSTEIMVNTTLAMEDSIVEEMKAWKPDCIVADSVAVWGKLIALKLGIPFVSSTTTFAFNQYSSRIMKTSFKQMLNMILSMRKCSSLVKKLNDKGYPVKKILSLIQNDNNTETIVYTSPEFQPYSETFSDKYLFIGPSIRKLEYDVKKPERTTVYISLGTVNNMRTEFFKNCIKAFKDRELDVIMSVGDIVDIHELGDIPENITVKSSVNQIEVLHKADVFLSHCGMNSVNESLYCQVPLVLYPQTSEQSGVAQRVSDLGAGAFLGKPTPENIYRSVMNVLDTPSYKENAVKIAESFYRCGGAKAAADKIEEAAGK